MSPTGNTTHSVAGETLGPCSGLAICHYSDSSGFYLFYCDPCWNVVTDTWHQSLNNAKSQAEFEYSGIADKWRVVA